MILKYDFEGFTYVFDNAGIQAGDKVYPVNHWIIKDGVVFHTELIDKEMFGYLIQDPHTIVNLHYSNYKPYEVETTHGFSPVEAYFKLIEKIPIKQPERE